MQPNISSIHLTALPSGRFGRVIALGLLLVVILGTLGLTLMGAKFYASLQSRLDNKTAFLAHARTLVASIPHLQARADAAKLETDHTSPLLGAPSDDLALAILQEQVQSLADDASIDLATQEPVSASRQRAMRTIALRVTFMAPWDYTVHFLNAVSATKSPHLLVQNLQVSAGDMTQDEPMSGPSRRLSVSVVIAALRDGSGHSLPRPDVSH
ncbi:MULTISPECIES: type II secretion system protein GspM [Gluconobacter]|uniref:type II secretion system protein GspM n=1 Tax=Gluconobacter TaxID=441 RepID=UPI001B8B3C35|nr:MULTISPECIES: type II secretion system protein GspM [Gluconobacter]MBS0984401.1 hypothetical protein [Gluconobacter cerinus]